MSKDQSVILGDKKEELELINIPENHWLISSLGWDGGAKQEVSYFKKSIYYLNMIGMGAETDFNYAK